MISRNLQLFVFLALMLLSKFSWGQTVPPLPCRDLNGVPVQFILNPQLPDVGRATFFNGYPVVFINPFVLRRFSPIVQHWWYVHECGHHALGIGKHSEVDADCYAGKALVWNKIIKNLNDISRIQYELQNLPGNAFTGHLPGSARGQIVGECASKEM